MSKDNFYITTPIYYPSGQPHMGHAYSSIIADVFARFKRLDGSKVFFLTGTDEHGLKIQNAAKESKKTPKNFCDDISKVFKDLTKTLNLSNDDFIRTTESRHHSAVKDLWKKLVQSGDIYLSKYKGWYSISDEAYYSNDEVTEKNGKKIAIISGSLVDWVEEDSYFFKLSAWQEKLLKHYEINKTFILPEARRNEVVSFVKGGLKDLSVSRTSFTWGIKVPEDNSHIIYVWLDALTNYLSALNYPDKKSELFKKFWPASVHVIGKDILRFHAVYWPAFLLAAGIELPKRIFGHGWILAGDEKMSKSKGNILNPINVIKKYGLDQLRYYLMKEVSLGNDGTISLENMESCINSDLANNFGNLCQRVLAFISSNCENKVPKFNELTAEDNDLLNSFSDSSNKLRQMMDRQELNNFIKIVIDNAFKANKYINDMQPWAIKNSDNKRMQTVLYVALETIRKISILLSPIIPESTKKVFDALDLDKEHLNFESIQNHHALVPGNKLKKLNILFKKF